MKIPVEKPTTTEGGPAMSQVKVLVVDDSAFMRQVISNMLEADPDISVVGVARDGEDALAKLARHEPNVLTLDLEMPKMDGLAFLAKLMSARPIPVVVVSSWATAGAEYTLRALELGAVDFVTKPVAMPSEAMWDIAEELLAKVKTAAMANISDNARAASSSLPPGIKGLASDAVICCLAASTGGPRALQSIVTRLPPRFPFGVLMVQHMPPGFTRVFASRLSELVSVPVKEAEDGDLLAPGEIKVAPAGLQTRVTGSPGKLRLKVGPEPSSVFRPSADVSFTSIAETCGGQALGVILTGMGQDGARGLLAMRKAGARTVAESADTCVVYGMPRMAAELGAADMILPLWEIPEAILTLTGLA